VCFLLSGKGGATSRMRVLLAGKGRVTLGQGALQCGEARFRCGGPRLRLHRALLRIFACRALQRQGALRIRANLLHALLRFVLLRLAQRLYRRCDGALLVLEVFVVQVGQLAVQRAEHRGGRGGTGRGSTRGGHWSAGQGRH